MWFFKAPEVDFPDSGGDCVGFCVGILLGLWWKGLL